jgi:hypothetical protein
MMDVEKLVEEVEKAIFRDWKTSPTKDIARSAILATLRGVREPDDETGWAGYNVQEADVDAAYTAMIDHLIKTVEG